MPRRKPKPKPKSELCRAREEQGLTINQLAKLAGVNRSTVFSAEHANRNTRGSTRNKLLKALAQNGDNGMPPRHIDRAILAIERLALAAERVAQALETRTKK